MIVGPVLKHFMHMEPNAMMSEVLDAVASKAHTSAQRLAPVDTTQLKMTITKEDISDMRKEIIAHAPYAIYVEYGTGPKGRDSQDAGEFNYHSGEVKVRTKGGEHLRHTQGTHPRPFMRMALAEAKHDAERLVKAILERGKQ